MLGFRFKRAKTEDAANALYEAIAAHARAPDFYLRFGASDTPDGRFEMLLLHAFLLLRRLGRGAEAERRLAQAVFDRMFAHLETTLRETTGADMAIGKTVKGMASAFYGRAAAYHLALDPDVDPSQLGLPASKAASGPEPLESALLRNLFATTRPNRDQVAAMADYVRRAAAQLDAQTNETFMAGQLSFPAPIGH